MWRGYPSVVTESRRTNTPSHVELGPGLGIIEDRLE